VGARLGHNRAAAAEKEHTTQLLEASRERLATIAREAGEEHWISPEFTRCESAVQGLRKTILRRPWNPRCEQCGVRHEDIEFSTCRFWQAWVV
jgi:hypothetical protein